MINCIAVDDEKYALDLLIDNIRRVPFLHLVAVCKNGVEALRFLEREPIDLVFLDIQMPALNGLQLLRKLKIKPLVIIVSAFKSYALESYDLDVLDYLLKPISFERFMKAANKANDYYQLIHKQKDSKPDYIFVNADYRLVKIDIDTILYVEGMKDYVKFFVANSSKPIVPKLSLKMVEEMLPEDHFARIHKSYIVNEDKVVSLQKREVQLVNQITLPLSRNYRPNYSRLLANSLILPLQR
jgi:DNA-binding LytR/AlgR family response regulator